MFSVTDPWPEVGRTRTGTEPSWDGQNSVSGALELGPRDHLFMLFFTRVSRVGLGAPSHHLESGGLPRCTRRSRGPDGDADTRRGAGRQELQVPAGVPVFDVLSFIQGRPPSEVRDGKSEPLKSKVRKTEGLQTAEPTDVCHPQTCCSHGMGGILYIPPDQLYGEGRGLRNNSGEGWQLGGKDVG